MKPIKKKRFIGICKVCHKRSKWISKNNLCEKCIKNRMLNANQQIKSKQGPIYEKWKERLIQSIKILE